MRYARESVRRERSRTMFGGHKREGAAEVRHRLVWAGFRFTRERGEGAAEGRHTDLPKGLPGGLSLSPRAVLRAERLVRDPSPPPRVLPRVGGGVWGVVGGEGR